MSQDFPTTPYVGDHQLCPDTAIVESPAIADARQETARQWATRPTAMALFGLQSTPDVDISIYRATCNDHTRPALIALGIVPELFEDARDTASVLRDLRAGLEIFNAVLSLWKSAGLYPWTRDLNEARDWLLRADSVLVKLNDKLGRSSIAQALTEIDKLIFGG